MEITGLAQHGMRKVTRGVADGAGAAPLRDKLDVVLDVFDRDVARLVAQARWEDTVRARHAFVAARADAPAAELAIKRAATTLDVITGQYAALEDRTQVPAGSVARLLRDGVLRPIGKVYTSGKYGLGATWVFAYIGGGRLDPEWHIHFQAAGRTTNVAGAGWKSGGQKFGVGVKTFDMAAPIQKALKDLGQWKEPKI